MGEAIIAYVIMCFAIIGVVVTLGFMSEYLMLLRIMRQLRKHSKADADAESGVEMGKVNRVDETICEDCGKKLEDIGIAFGNKCYLCVKAGSAETGGEKAAPEKCHTLDLPEGFHGQRCGKCDSLFPDGNFKFCSECGAHLVYALEGQ